MINDEVRVYKGGSWKDREYWLRPCSTTLLSSRYGNRFYWIPLRNVEVRIKVESKKQNKKLILNCINNLSPFDISLGLFLLHLFL